MEINYLPILVAAVADMVVGAIWFGPLFGKHWMKLTGMKASDMKNAPKSKMQKMYFFTFLSSLVVAWALYTLGNMLNLETVAEWSKLGFLLGLFLVGGNAVPS